MTLGMTIKPGDRLRSKYTPFILTVIEQIGEEYLCRWDVLPHEREQISRFNSDELEHDFRRLLP